MGTVRNKSKIKLLAALGLTVILWTWKGCQDKIDPDWVGLEQKIAAEYQTLDRSVDSLQWLWQSIHPNLKAPTPTHAFDIMADPFLPTMEFSTFKRFVGLLKQRKFLLLSSVSGGGNSTLVDRLSKFVATSPDHLLDLWCAPQFDIEYHRQYIGEDKDGVWKNGKLLQFFDQCAAKPNEQFVFVVDDFDKINPETFFGPELWEKFNNSDYTVKYGGKIIELPSNFHLIMVTQAGVGERIKLNNEHFRRLGDPVYINPNVPELICFLQVEYKKRKRQLADSKNNEKLIAQVNSLEDTLNLKRFIYSFSKINEYIKQNYGPNFQLGTWSNIRKLYLKNEYDKLLLTFIEHVNSFQPDNLLEKKDFEKITHAIETNGRLKDSNIIMSTVHKMEEMGFLTEFIVGLSFLILSAITSWYFFKKRQLFIKDYTDKTYQLIQQFEAGHINYDKASEEFVKVKKEVDMLVMDKKVTYTEATFFYNFLEDKIKRIEMARQVNANFQDLVRVFMEDGVLSDNEYRKLLSFLQEIKHKISVQDYVRFKEEVEELYNGSL